MSNFHILTNNPLVAEKYPPLTLFYDGRTVEEIFLTARDEIHLGAELINHPLSGSVKPNESPYKSLVLSMRRGSTDLPALQLIEGALAVLKKLGTKHRQYSEQVLCDFRVIDLDLLDSAVMALPAEFHK